MKLVNEGDYPHKMLVHVYKSGEIVVPLLSEDSIRNLELVTMIGYVSPHYNDKNLKIAQNTGMISDGYHTFNELYDHRALLTSMLFSFIQSNNDAPCTLFKAKAHADGTMFDGMFIVGALFDDDKYFSYHYDMDRWDMFSFVDERWYAPLWTPELDININEFYNRIMLNRSSGNDVTV